MEANMKNCEIFELEYYGLRLWYEMEMESGQVCACGCEAADKDGVLELWDNFTKEFQDELYALIEEDAERTMEYYSHPYRNMMED